MKTTGSKVNRAALWVIVSLLAVLTGGIATLVRRDAKDYRVSSQDKVVGKVQSGKLRTSASLSVTVLNSLFNETYTKTQGTEYVRLLFDGTSTFKEFVGSSLDNLGSEYQLIEKENEVQEYDRSSGDLLMVYKFETNVPDWLGLGKYNYPMSVRYSQEGPDELFLGAIRGHSWNAINHLMESNIVSDLGTETICGASAKHLRAGGNFVNASVLSSDGWFFGDRPVRIQTTVVTTTGTITGTSTTEQCLALDSNTSLGQEDFAIIPQPSGIITLTARALSDPANGSVVLPAVVTPTLRLLTSNNEGDLVRSTVIFREFGGTMPDGPSSNLPPNEWMVGQEFINNSNSVSTTLIISDKDVGPKFVLSRNEVDQPEWSLDYVNDPLSFPTPEITSLDGNQVRVWRGKGLLDVGFSADGHPTVVPRDTSNGPVRWSWSDDSANVIYAVQSFGPSDDLAKGMLYDVLNTTPITTH